MSVFFSYQAHILYRMRFRFLQHHEDSSTVWKTEKFAPKKRFHEDDSDKF